MKKTTYILSAIATAVLTVGCSSSQLQSGFPSADHVIKSSWQNVPENMKGRLVQDETQKICSAGRDNPSKEMIARAEALAKATPVVLPKDGNMMGDWKKVRLLLKVVSVKGLVMQQQDLMVVTVTHVIK